MNQPELLEELKRIHSIKETSGATGIECLLVATAFIHICQKKENGQGIVEMLSLDDLETLIYCIRTSLELTTDVGLVLALSYEIRSKIAAIKKGLN